MAQKWHDLLFAHWPIPLDALRPKIPAGLQIDTFQDHAWLGIVPFRMTGVRLRATPPLPWLSAFPELNVRTYVTRDNKPGIWFFSLDATNPIAVAGARLTFHLPYFHARMNCQERSGWITYHSDRVHPKASLDGRYRPMGPVFRASPGTLEHFLAERYCLYAANSRGQLFRCEIHHLPWPLQPAESSFEKNTMAEAAGLALPQQKPLLHFARRQDVAVWRLKRC